MILRWTSSTPSSLRWRFCLVTLSKRILGSTKPACFLSRFSESSTTPRSSVSMMANFIQRYSQGKNQRPRRKHSIVDFEAYHARRSTIHPERSLSQRSQDQDCSPTSRRKIPQGCRGARCRLQRESQLGACQPRPGGICGYQARRLAQIATDR